MSDYPNENGNGLSNYGPSSPNNKPKPSPQGHQWATAEHTTELSQQIQKNIQRKASSQEFKLNIADQDFYDIPDVNIESQRPIHTSAEISSPRPPANRSDSTGNRTRNNATAKRPPSSQNGGRPPQGKKRKATRSSRIFGSMVYVLAVVGVSIFLSIFILQSMNDYLGLMKQGEIQSVFIPENSSSYEIGKILKENGVISQPLTFSLYYDLKGIDEKFVGGEEYMLDPKDAYDQIFAVLTNTTDESSIVKITIPEGRTIRETGAILEENGVCSSDDFVKALNDAFEKQGYEWMSEISTDPSSSLYLPLEGYIFPNTHTMLIGESPESVVKRFLDDFTYQYSLFKDTMESKGMTLNEVMTLASLIQRECSGHTDDMYSVSQVFHNRLADGSPYPNLQSDVTINYVENDIKPYETQQSQVDLYASVYNTYKCEGLPVGPICNPGFDAIQAALYPDAEYASKYFFITDANDKFYYASTYQEHLGNIKTASAVKNEEGQSNVGGVATE